MPPGWAAASNGDAPRPDGIQPLGPGESAPCSGREGAPEASRRKTSRPQAVLCRGRVAGGFGWRDHGRGSVPGRPGFRRRPPPAEGGRPQPGRRLPGAVRLWRINGVMALRLVRAPCYWRCLRRLVSPASGRELGCPPDDQAPSGVGGADSFAFAMYPYERPSYPDHETMRSVWGPGLADDGRSGGPGLGHDGRSGVRGWPAAVGLGSGWPMAVGLRFRGRCAWPVTRPERCHVSGAACRRTRIRATASRTLGAGQPSAAAGSRLR